MSERNRMLAVAVGNSRTRWGVFEGTELLAAHSLPNASAGSIAAELPDSAKGVEVAVVASVNDPVALGVERALIDGIGCEVGRINRDVAIPLKHTLLTPETLGVDRALSALASWDRARQACVVVDAGTAITVDFIDGGGVFHGGAILPGGRLMLEALHAGTEQLPESSWPPASGPTEPMGRSTTDAMLQGVFAAARGGVRFLVEQYSEHYGGYPQVVATGGDAALFFEDDGLVEHIIPDLQLMGIRLCLDRARSETDE